jgi:hypothetical protein
MYSAIEATLDDVRCRAIGFGTRSVFSPADRRMDEYGETEQRL